MSNIAQTSPCVEHSTIHDSDDSRGPINRRNTEVQLLNDNSEVYFEPLNDNSEVYFEPVSDGSEVYLEPLNDNSENSIEPTCNGSENNVVSSNSDFYDSLKPTLNSSSDYLQLISDDHNYLQLTSDGPNTSSLQRSREGAGSCLNAASESEAYLQPVESRLHSYRQPVNERPLCSNDHIESNNIVYAGPAEYDDIGDVAMVGFQPLDNTRSRSQQYNNLVCDDLHTESSFESISREQPQQVQDVILPANERL
jgi:hypothetical protein